MNQMLDFGYIMYYLCQHNPIVHSIYYRRKGRAPTPAFFSFCTVHFSFGRLLIAICTVAKGPRETVSWPRDGFLTKETVSLFKFARYLFQIGRYVFKKLVMFCPTPPDACSKFLN